MVPIKKNLILSGNYNYDGRADNLKQKEKLTSKHLTPVS